MKDLKIIVPENFKKFGEEVNKHIQEIRESNENYLVDTSFVRFNNGEGKVVLNESVRDKDLYILTDVSNYDNVYVNHMREQYMSPDDHMMDVHRILSAECGRAAKRTLIMPYLYESRQDKKETRESLDCAISLQELVKLGVDEFVTCDVHNKGIMNAVPTIAFENVYLTDKIILDLIDKEKIEDFKKIICIAPDEGAMKRARLFSELLGFTQVGSFYKQRDYTDFVNGKYRIVEHKFLGPENLEGMTAIVTDDMIASGGSILETAEALKKIGAKKVLLVVTFALFTEGIQKFDEYYNKGLFDKVYATNVSYVPKEIIDKPWFESVDCSYKIGHLISELNYGHSVHELISGKQEVAEKVKVLRREKK